MLPMPRPFGQKRNPIPTMTYETDILIAYAAQDDSTEEGRQGWVSYFSHFLEMALRQLFGIKPVIVLKSEKDSFAKTLLEKTAILMPVISPGFVQSGVEKYIVTPFRKTIEGDSRIRICKVLKEPVSAKDQPHALKYLSDYPLYPTGEANETRSDSGHTTTLFIDPGSEKNFGIKAVDLAYDIRDALAALYQSKGDRTSPPPAQKCIYLARTSHELSVKRNIVKRELRQLGYRVLPDKAPPQGKEKAKKAVSEALQQCCLSVHLIGNTYDDISAMENELAGQRSAVLSDRNRFSRLIWIANRTDRTDKRQTLFMEELKRESMLFVNTEILLTGFEHFKNTLRQEIVREATEDPPAPEVPPNAQHRPVAYILFHNRDSEAAEPIKEVVTEAGFRVVLPPFKGEFRELRNTHIHHLRNFDIAVIVQKNAGDRWVQMKRLDLLKAPGFGRSKPVKGKIIVRLKDDPSVIEANEYPDIETIDGDITAATRRLKLFLQALNPPEDEPTA